MTTFTHKGWMYICPVYIADPTSDIPTIEPRHWVFELPMLISRIFGQIVGGFLVHSVTKLKDPITV